MSDVSLVAGPERAEKYEGMLVVLYNVNVVARGVPEGPDLYYLASGTDTLLGTDIESGMSAPDSTFFVRKGDRLGFVSGIITERSTGGTRYVLLPRGIEDYKFIGSNRELSSWSRMKRRYRQVES